MRAISLCLCALALATSAYAQLLGGVSSADPSDKSVVDAAAFAVQQINARENSMFAQLLSVVVEASSQVVAGVKYSLVVETLRSTECRNDGELHSMCSCAADSSNPLRYEVEVLSQPWKQPEMQLLSTKSVPVTSANSVDATSSKLSIGSAISAASPDFQSFLKSYKPDYCNNAAEISRRADIFQANMGRIKKLQQNEKGSAKYGVTQFADLTEQEFLARYAQSTPMKPSTTMRKAPLMDVKDTPTSFDWREHNAVTAVKNQGGCGSCWAFSTTGNIEGQWAIKKGKLVSLSEQELVDCDKVDHGCKGGLPSDAYKQIMKLGGLTTEQQYPYTGRDGSCHFNPSTEAVNINGSIALPQDEEQLAAWLAANGPISIGINAGPMQFYFGGISHPWKLFCNPDHLDHGVLLVGYGVKDGEPYWIVKNSWGATWGEEGYYLVYRGAGVCGLNRMATSSVVA
ncbi:cathepsin L-like [Sycon ciliatum]|uniref:cathepsin L-like n=1 Tax=Sycon ciliatum TaxID=27933 RepID=UPI0020ADBB20|eukprot:scpid71479/ scgid34634/ Putative cysteine proteinase CG12163